MNLDHGDAERDEDDDNGNDKEKGDGECGDCEPSVGVSLSSGSEHVVWLRHERRLENVDEDENGVDERERPERANGEGARKNQERDEVRG